MSGDPRPEQDALSSPMKEMDKNRDRERSAERDGERNRIAETAYETPGCRFDYWT